MTRSSRWLGLATFALLIGCAHQAANGQGGLTVEQARQKLRAISPKPVQLWVVVHIRAHKTLKPDGTVDEAKLIQRALDDADAVVRGGAELLMIINSRCEMPLYERVITAVREKYPSFPLGISALAYGPINLTEGFRLAKKYDARVVWGEVVPDERVEYEDDDGSYKPAGVISRALALETQAKDKPEAMHVAGVHMKYTRPLDGKSFEEAVRAALGSVDGINVTGPKTGVLADVEHIRSARTNAGQWPVGLASGVTEENVESVYPFVDYLIVGTSLKMNEDPLRTDEAKVRSLRAKLDQLGAKAR